MADTVHTATTQAPEAPEATALGLDAGGWVAMSMVAVILVMLWVKVPKIVAGMLDKQIGAIREQLDAATTLRKQAEGLKSEYEARAKAAEAHAETVKSTANREAEEIVAEAKKSAAALIDRRQKMAEAKIASAERAAIAELRARASDAAISASRGIIAADYGAAADKPQVDEAISAL